MRKALFWTCVAFACTMTSAAAVAATSDAYPTRPIRVILGFSGGGGDDYLARLIGPRLTERFGQPVVVDNRPGAASTIAAEMTARANPDGYTLMLGSSTPLASAPSLYPKLGYELMRDFTFISRVASSGNVLLAHPSLPVKSIQELVILARAKPKAIAYGSAGVASVAHLAMELLQSQAGIVLHHVPYKGGGQVVTALAGGEVTLGFTNLAAGMPMIQSKRLIPLAVSTPKRTPALPGVPTIAEAGYPGYDVTNTFGIFGPAGIPPAIVKQMNAELRNIVQAEDIKAKAASQALDAMGSTPDEYRAIMKSDLTLWTRVIKGAGIAVQ